MDLGAYTGDTVLSYLKTTGRTAISGSTAMRSRQRPSKSSRRPCAVSGCCVPPEGRGGCRGDLIPGEPPDQRLLQHPGARNRGGSPRDHLGHGHSRAHHHDQADIEALSKRPCKGPKTTSCGTIPSFSSRCTTTTRTFGRSPALIHALSEAYTFYLRYNSSPLYPTEITLFAL